MSQPEWFIAIDGQQSGPMTLDDARAHLAAAGNADAALVWRPGFDKWQRASQVAEFAARAMPFQVPPAVSQVAAAAQPSMRSKEFWFSLQGRVSRKTYWIGNLLIMLAVFAAAMLAAAISAATDGGTMTFVLALPLVALILFLFYCSFTICYRRIHDRGKSAWWLALFILAPAILDGVSRAAGGGALSLISSVISIWALVELGFLRGTVGPNEFGPDPLEPGA